MINLLALVLATFMLVLLPGPNVALIVANSLQYGLRTGAMTVLGTTAGVAVQLLLVVLGLAAILQVAAEALTWLRWCGVAYLLYLGIKTFRESPIDLRNVKAARQVFAQSFILAAVNPKTLLFSAAFLPQFIVQGGTYSIAAVAAVYLAVIFMGDLAWALSANFARRYIERIGDLRNKLSGAIYILAGIGLGLSRR